MTSNHVNFFLDTEFIESGPNNPIQLLSIGIVCENGNTFYRENFHAILTKANDFVRENVIPNLTPASNYFYNYSMTEKEAREVTNNRLKDSPLRALLELKEDLIAFVLDNSINKTRFYTYYGAYDWVLLSQIFGRMIDLPKYMPMYSLDLKQWSVQLEERFNQSIDLRVIPQIKKHHALEDAKWNFEVYKYLKYLEDNVNYYFIVEGEICNASRPFMRPLTIKELTNKYIKETYKDENIPQDITATKENS